MDKVGFYFDGFNMFHRLKDHGLPHLKWLDYRKLAENSLAKWHKARVEILPFLEQEDGSIPFELKYVKLFTATPAHIPGDTQDIHRMLMAANRARGVDVIEGRFKRKDSHCSHCKASYVKYEEKESDVDLAVHMLKDCLTEQIDHAFLVSSDSDLCAAIRMIGTSCRRPDRNYPFVTVHNVIPPKVKGTYRSDSTNSKRKKAPPKSAELELAITSLFVDPLTNNSLKRAYFPIQQLQISDIENSLLGDYVETAKGRRITRPEKFNPPY